MSKRNEMEHDRMTNRTAVQAKGAENKRDGWHVGIVQHKVVTKGDGTHAVTPYELARNEWPYGIPKKDGKGSY